MTGKQCGIVGYKHDAKAALPTMPKLCACIPAHYIISLLALVFDEKLKALATI